MSKIIIGIHGLGNKPPPKTLSAWWKAAIREGLGSIKKPKEQFTFELVYWAHCLYPVPLKPRIKDTKKSPQVIRLFKNSGNGRDYR